jgi:hypothetical protein
MARIRKTVFWATRAVALLISFLFSAVQLAPPAWANTAGAADPRSDAAGGVALTALIADFSRSDGFDRRLSDELDRLEGVGGAGEGSGERPQPQQIALTLDGMPLPAPNVQQPQAPKGQPQQAFVWDNKPRSLPQRQQAYISDGWQGKPRSLPQQAPQAQPQQALVIHQPQMPPSIRPKIR